MVNTDTIYRLDPDIGRYISADRYIGRALMQIHALINVVRVHTKTFFMHLDLLSVREALLPEP